MRRGADVGYGGAERVRARLLDSRLEKVDGLEEDCREDTRPQTCAEVEG